MCSTMCNADARFCLLCGLVLFDFERQCVSYLFGWCRSIKVLGWFHIVCSQCIAKQYKLFFPEKGSPPEKISAPTKDRARFVWPNEHRIQSAAVYNLQEFKEDPDLFL